MCRGDVSQRLGKSEVEEHSCATGRRRQAKSAHGGVEGKDPGGLRPPGDGEHVYGVGVGEGD